MDRPGPKTDLLFPAEPYETPATKDKRPSLVQFRNYAESAKRYHSEVNPFDAPSTPGTPALYLP